MQLINLETPRIPLTNHASIADLYVIPHQCISAARPGVDAVCASLQAAMASLDETQYKLLLEHLDMPFWDYSLPQLRLLHQLLEKHLLVFATSPKDYGLTKITDHQFHIGDVSPIHERYLHIPPVLCQEVRDLLHNIIQSGVIWGSHSPWAAPIVLERKNEGSL